MPVYSAKSSALAAFGPILDIQIFSTQEAADAMRQANMPIPGPLTVSALIDTGATFSVIKVGLAAQLNLHPVGIQYINTPTTQNAPCGRFLIEFIFPMTAGIQVPIRYKTVVTEAPMPGQNIQCLIGRDFLQHGILTYSGPDDMFIFSV